MNYLWIDTDAGLRSVVDRISTVKYIGLDTEFIGEGVYFPKLCLVQLFAETLEAPVLLDPLANLDITPLKNLLQDDSIEKIIHSPRQDLEVFYQTYGITLKPVFDTQLAASFLGYGDQPALARLLRDELDKTHEKMERYTDWSARPLSEAQCRYAAMDVLDLLSLRNRLYDQLVTANRCDWFFEESQIAHRTEVYIRNDDDAWQRVGDKRGLRRKELIVLRELSALRERVARHYNKPREYIISDRMIVQLARSIPRNEAELSRVRSWKGASQDLVAQILDAIRVGLTRTDFIAPDEGSRAPSWEAVAMADLLASWVKVISQRTMIAGSLLAVRSELDAFARWGVENPEHPMPPVRLTKGWRWEFLGKDLAAIAKGEKSIGLNAHNDQVLGIR